MKKLDLEKIMNIIQPGMKIPFYIDGIISRRKKIEIQDTILIAGTPRSGTTWLMEILGTIKGYTYLFEPLQPAWFPESRKIGFDSRTYIPYETDWAEGEDYLKKVFSGRIVSNLPLYGSKPKMAIRRLFGDKLIIKAVRMNRLLPWIAERFQIHSIVYIIRHPCAVVASQLKTKFYGYNSGSPPYRSIFPTRDMVLNDAYKIDILDSERVERIKKIKTQEEILAAIWCLDNLIPLSSPKKHLLTTVIYEKLIRYGEAEINRLFSEIEEDIPESAYKNLKIPSILTMRDEIKTVKNVDKQLSKWKSYLSKIQIEKILNIVSDFGLDFYTEKAEPNYENIKL